MKITITFKEPDAVSMAREEMEGLDATEQEIEAFDIFVDTYIRWGEYIDIEVDLDTGKYTIHPLDI